MIENQLKKLAPLMRMIQMITPPVNIPMSVTIHITICAGMSAQSLETPAPVVLTNGTQVRGAMLNAAHRQKIIVIMMDMMKVDILITPIVPMVPHLEYQTYAMEDVTILIKIARFLEMKLITPALMAAVFQ